MNPQVHVQDEYRFSKGAVEPFEIGAWLLSISAFPALADGKVRSAAAEALCARQIRAMCDANRSSAADWQAAFPIYAAIGIREEKRRLRTFQRRLSDRMIAGRMSLGFFYEGLSGQKAVLPSSIKRQSLNELSKLVQDQTNESEAENIEHRIWRASRRVIHLAAAFQVLIRSVHSGRSAGVGYDLNNLDLHVAVIELAHIHEELVHADPRFGRNRNDLIRVRLSG